MASAAGWNDLIAYEDWGVDPSALTTGGNVEVRATETEIRFLPRDARSAGIVFFPGALVDPDAYAPMLRKVAEAGYPAFLVKLPLRGYSTETAAAEARVFQEILTELAQLESQAAP